MCLDVSLPAGAPMMQSERSDITTQWAHRQVDAPRATGQLRFGIAQGATHAELPTRSIEEITALPFDGYALGGLAVGESKEEMLDCVQWAAPLLPESRLRYFMGIGDPEGILEVVARGVDNNGHRGRRGPSPQLALTWEGRLNLPAATYRTDSRPLDADCDLPACLGPCPRMHRHLVARNESFSDYACSACIICASYLLDLTARVRRSGRGFSSFRDGRPRMTRHAPPEEEPCNS